MTRGKVCLAYSGGLDTSCILAWLIEEGYDVVCFLGNVGQEEDWDAVREKALKIGAKEMIIDDLRREFIEELCFRAIQCNAIYEDRYLLGTSLARPVIARAQMRAAQRTGCEFVSHGCTGKGNDQIRFELAFYTIQPSIKVIAPWRDPKFFNRFAGRNDLLDYATKKGISVTSTKKAPWSMDANAAHCSYEAGILEDPAISPPEEMWTMTDNPLTAPDQPEEITIEFKKGIPISLKTANSTVTGSVHLFDTLNKIGKKHGIGRQDLVENRYIGLKSRACYDSPGMTLLRLAHLDIEGLVMDGQLRSLRDQFCTHNWSRLLYSGLYFTPECEYVENSILFSQKNVSGTVRILCFKGNAYVLGRASKTSKLYSVEEASMDNLAQSFSPEDTTGFITIQAIRLKAFGREKAEEGESLSRA